MQQTIRQKEQHSVITASVAGTPAVPFLDDMDISISTSIESLETEWRRLESWPHNSLHQGYEWCHAWAKAHNSRLCLVTGHVQGRCVMLLPLEIIQWQGVRRATFLGGRYNNINGGLFGPEFPVLGVHDSEIFIHKTRRAIAGAADLIALEGTPKLWRGAQHPLSALPGIENHNHTFQLPILSSFEATLSQLNAKRRRKKFRLQTRRMDEIGGYEHVRPTTADEQHGLLDTFFRQKAARLHSQGLPDVFGAPSVQAFFHDLLDAPADADHYPLQLHAIRLKGQHAGHIAAIAGLSRKGDHVICQFGAIADHLVPETSPGELLFWLMIEDCCRSGVGLFDFGLGDQPYKRSWCTVETVQHDLLIPLSWRGQIAARLHMALARAKAAIKRSQMAYRLLQRLRRARSASTPASEGSDQDHAA